MWQVCRLLQFLLTKELSEYERNVSRNGYKAAAYKRAAAAIADCPERLRSGDQVVGHESREGPNSDGENRTAFFSRPSHWTGSERALPTKLTNFYKRGRSESWRASTETPRQR